ncbi:hypothetical protein H4R19_002563 [Coemansia spiralis]|nr:hypothetical protein H4R19_002563 [Coemansia spiralis]
MQRSSSITVAWLDIETGISRSWEYADTTPTEAVHEDICQVLEGRESDFVAFDGDTINVVMFDKGWTLRDYLRRLKLNREHGFYTINLDVVAPQ